MGLIVFLKFGKQLYVHYFTNFLESKENTWIIKFSVV